MERKLSSTRPYLLRAMHEWIGDNGETPLVIVDATMDGVQVPEEHIKDGRIVLNVALSATRNLLMNNEGVSFDARFSGVARSVYFPIDALLGVYSRESGQGMQFQIESEGARQPTDTKPEGSAEAAGDDNSATEPTPTRPNGPNLRIVK